MGYIDNDSNNGEESWFKKMLVLDQSEKEVYLDDPVILQKQSTTIDFVDQIEKIPLNKVFKATDFFWADYDAIWYGSTKL